MRIAAANTIAILPAWFVSIAVKVLPEPDAFQYLNRMAPFLGGRNNGRKQAIAENLYRAVAGGELPMPTHPTQEVRHPGQYVPEHLQGAVGWTENGPVRGANVPLQMDEETRRMLTEEMGMLDDRRNSGEKLTEEEMERYRYLNDKLFT
ncbi:MAG TPA: hypothetical protein VIY48_08250 [Candidatus Paceibacterota bacterium]